MSKLTMKKLVTYAIAASLSIGIIGQSAQARGPGGPGGGPGGRPGGKRHGMQQMMEKLDLTSEQRKKLHDLKQKNRDKIAPLQEQARASQKKLNEALQSDVKTDELRKLHKQHQELRTNIEDLRFEQVLSVREILTPEQRKKFQEIRGPGRGGPGNRGEQGDRDDVEDGE